MQKVNHSMFVIKRDGTKEKVYFDKITARNLKLASDLNINPEELSVEVIKGLKNGMTTRDIDRLSCETCVSKSIYELEYGILATRIAVNDLHKNTPNTFNEYLQLIKHLLQDRVYNFATKYINEIQNIIDNNYDNKFSYFGFKTIERSYLLKNENLKTIERPQYMYMRIALGIHSPFYVKDVNSNITDDETECLNLTFKTYKKLREFKLSHASPTMFNSGLKNGQLGSCFLLTCEDSIDGITKCWKQCSFISKFSGGIGFDITRVRSKGSKISGNNGISNGICPFIKVFDSIARAINQGGKREGKIAIYLQPWHPDLSEFLTIRKNTTIEEIRAMDMNTALWIPDIFFTRTSLVFKGQSDIKWSFFCPKKYPQLVDLWGQEFTNEYIKLENENKYEFQVNLKDLINEIGIVVAETGQPYMLSKDNANLRNNQKDINDNLKRVINCSNLCTEIYEYQTSDSIASCNLASIGLTGHLINNTFDINELCDTTELAVINLNRIIDINYYPLNEIKNNNQQLRPIGIGIQGVANVLMALNSSWVDLNDKPTPEAIKIFHDISENIYYSSLNSSCKLAKKFNKYNLFDSSPIANGILAFDYDKCLKPISISNAKWDELRNDIKEYGLLNSLTTAYMPTVSTAQILNNYECFEPITSNLFTRQTKSGDFPIVNTYLYDDLQNLNLLNKVIIDKILENNGSIQDIHEIPTELKLKYKTVWEIKNNAIVKLNHIFSSFTDQGISFNIYLSEPTPKKLWNLWLDCWNKGFKTLSYYTRSKPAVNPIKFNLLTKSNVVVDSKKSTKVINNKTWICEDGTCCSG